MSLVNILWGLYNKSGELRRWGGERKRQRPTGVGSLPRKGSAKEALRRSFTFAKVKSIAQGAACSAGAWIIACALALCGDGPIRAI